jgi:hypothetical protein
MRHKATCVLLVGLLLLFGSACTDDDDGGAAGSTTTTESSTSTSSTATTQSTTTTTPANGPPEWVAVAQDLYNRLHELRVHPDPAAVTTLVDQNCPCYADELSTIEFFAQDGIRYESRPSQVLSVAVRGEVPEANLTNLLVDVQAFTARLYNPDGSLYQEIEAPPPQQVNLTVSPSGPNGEWRIHDEFSAG